MSADYSNYFLESVARYNDDFADVFSIHLKKPVTQQSSKVEKAVSNVAKKADDLVVRDDKFLNADGKIDWEKWAPDGGRVPGTIKEGQTLNIGTVIDRYGNPYGKYTSPVGIPYEQRALPYIENPNAYHKYKVIKSIDGVTVSKIAAAFEQPGGGIQYELPSAINRLIKENFLKEIL